MPLYEFKCQKCLLLFDITAETPLASYPCLECGHKSLRRYSFSFKTPMQPHYNPTVGSYVSNESKFNDGLKRASEAATIRTGIVHDYQPTDPTDMKANGVTSEGLKETFDAATDTRTRDVLRKYIDSD